MSTLAKITPLETVPTGQNKLPGLTVDGLMKLCEYTESKGLITMAEVRSQIKQWTGDDPLPFIDYLRTYHSIAAHPVLSLNFSELASEIANVHVICHSTCIFRDVLNAVREYEKSCQPRWKFFSKQQVVTWIDIFTENLWRNQHYILSEGVVESLSTIGNSILLFNIHSLNSSAASSDADINPALIAEIFPLLRDAKFLWEIYIAIRSKNKIRLQVCGPNESKLNHCMQFRFKEFVEYLCGVNISTCQLDAFYSDSPWDTRDISENDVNSLMCVVVGEMARDRGLHRNWRHLFDTLHDGTAGEIRVGDRRLLRKICRDDDWSSRMDGSSPLRTSMPVIYFTSDQKHFREGLCAVNEAVVGLLLDWFLVRAKDLFYGDSAGTDCPVVLESAMLVVHMLLERELSADAEVLLSQCLGDAESVVGEAHPLTIRFVHLQRALYIKKGQFDQAEAAAERCRLSYNPAGFPYARSLCDMAEIQLLRALHLLSQTTCHPCCEKGWPQLDRAVVEEYATSLQPTAALFSDVDISLQEAMSALAACCVSPSDMLDGKKNKQKLMLACCHRMGVVCEKQGQFEDALQHFVTAFHGRVQLLGPHHADSLSSGECMAKAQWLLGRNEHLKDCEHSLRWLLQMWSELVHKHHEVITMTLFRIGTVSEAQSKYSQAYEMYVAARRSRSIMREDPCSDEFMELLYNTGRTEWHLGKLDEATRSYSALTSHRSKRYGSSSSQALESITLMRRLLQEQDRLVEAEIQCVMELKCAEKLHKKSHPLVLDALLALGDVCRRAQKLDEAEESYLTAIKRIQKAQSPDKSGLFVAMRSLGLVYERKGLYERAREQYNQVYRYLADMHGPEYGECVDLTAKIRQIPFSN